MNQPRNDQRASGWIACVEREVEGAEERALVLPGINPSFELLREVGPDAVLEAALHYAQGLARAWGLNEVWIPTHGAIATNRGPVRQALEERKWAVRKVRTVSFSVAPYSYSVDEVWVLSAGEPCP